MQATGDSDEVLKAIVKHYATDASGTINRNTNATATGDSDEVLKAIVKHYATDASGTINRNTNATATGDSDKVRKAIAKHYVTDGASTGSRRQNDQDIDLRVSGDEEEEEEEVALPQPTLRASPRLPPPPANPGAYPHPGPNAGDFRSSHVAAPDPSSLGVNNPISGQDQDNDKIDIAVANVVPDEEQDLNLPLAVGVDQDQMAARAAHQKRQSACKTMVFVMSGLVMIVGVALLLGFLLSRDGKDTNDASVNLNDSHQAGAGYNNADRDDITNDEMEAAVLKLFPNSTLKAIEDVNSPQRKALEWILNDFALTEYIQNDWRVRQRFALVTFYHATDGPSWKNNSRWLSYADHECTWFGQEFYFYPVYTEGFRVIEIDHPNKACAQPMMVEAINAGIQDNLTSSNHDRYKNIWLYDNNLQGTLPLELFWLTALRSLSIRMNAIGGNLSSHIGHVTNLEALSITGNPFTGHFPTEIGLLSNFFFLTAIGNHFTGTVPSELGLLPQLETMMLDASMLTGTIPTELFTFANYQFLYLFDNLLTGTIPTQIGHASDIVDVYVDRNNLIGTIPSEIGLLRSLRRLGLYNNSLTGPICTELGQLSSGALLVLELQFNQLSAAIPSELGLLSNLTHFFAQENQFTGGIPAEVSMLVSNNNTSLVAFNVAGNNDLSGEVGSDQGLCWLDPSHYNSDCRGDELLDPDCRCDCPCP